MDNKKQQTTRANQLVLERLLEHHRRCPDYVCCYFLNSQGNIEGQITIKEWVLKARRVAAVLRSKNVQAGDRVIVALPTSEEFMVVFLGLWWIGAIPVPLINPMPGLRKEAFRDRFVHIIANCTPKGAVFHLKRKELHLEVHNGKLFTPEIGTEVWNYQELCPPNESLDMATDLEPVIHSEETIAFIQYTSGSTGDPKGVTITQGNLRANISAVADTFGMVMDFDSGVQLNKVLSWMPLYHDMGLIGGLLFSTYCKAPLYLLSPVSFLTRPAVWLESISRYRVTLSLGNNFAYHLCARRLKPELMPGLDLSCWRLGLNGSEPVNADTLEYFCQKFAPYGFKETTYYPVYGMAEATVAITLPQPGSRPIIDKIKRKELVENGKALPANDGQDGNVFLVANGSCLRGHTLQIKEPNGDRVLGEREIGEICFAGPSVTPGYFEQNKSFSAFGDELRTGDLGYLADGNLFVVDRLKDIIQIAGNTYFPSDIERQVEKVSAVRRGRVVSFDIRDQRSGTNSLVIVAAVANKIDAAAVVKEIRKRVFSAFGIAPYEIVLTQKQNIPLTSSGKIRRRKCRELFFKGELTPYSPKNG